MNRNELVIAILLGSALVGLQAGCDEPPAPDTASLPATVECKLFWRASNTVGPGESPMDPKFQHQERTILVGPNVPASDRLGDVTLQVNYLVNRFEGSFVRIGAAFDDKPLVAWLYQLPTNPPPRNQFIGGHGFTGLVYLIHPTKEGDYQFFCAFGAP